MLEAANGTDQRLDAVLVELRAIHVLIAQQQVRLHDLYLAAKTAQQQPAKRNK